MKTLSVLTALLGLATAAEAEDWKCAREAGCTARINEDGVLKEVSFRKGDDVETEAGWIVSPDDGWEKLDTGPLAVSTGSPGGTMAATGGPEVEAGSGWGGGLSSVTVNMSLNPTVNTVTVSVTSGGGTSSGATGTPGPSCTAADPTCVESGTMTVGGKTYRVKDGKLQRKNSSGRWINMRKVKSPPSPPGGP